MNIVNDINYLKTRVDQLRCSGVEILLSSTVADGDQALGCYKFAINTTTGEEFFRDITDTPNLWSVISAGSGFPLVSTIDSSTVDFTGSGTSGDPLIGAIPISKIDGNAIEVLGSGLYVPSTMGSSNTILSGGIVTWISGYTYNISAATYNIQGATYTSPSTDVTLTVADVTNDRLDLFVLDTSGVASALTGVPSNNPAAPTAEPSLQVGVGIVLVTANSTQPVVVQEYIYRENIAPWTTTANFPVRLNPNSSSSPLVGSKSIEATASLTGDFIAFSNTAESLSQYNVLIFKIKSKSAWLLGSLSLQFSLAGVNKGSIVTLKDGTYSFLSSNTTDIQIISIPISAFSLPSNIDKLTITVINNGTTLGFRIDDVQFQKAIVPFIGNYWYALGDDIINNNPGNVNLSNGISFQPNRTILANGTILIEPNVQGIATGLRIANPTNALATNIALVTFEPGGSTAAQYAMSAKFLGDINQDVLKVFAAGHTSIGTSTTPDKRASLDVNSTGRYILITRLTTTQRDLLHRGVSSTTINSGGTGYQLPPTITFTNPASGGIVARGHCTISGGVINSVIIDERGAGYDSTNLADLVVTITNSIVVGMTGGSGGSITAVINSVSRTTGALIFNTTSNQLEFFDGTNWTAVGSGGGGLSLLGTTTGNDTTNALVLVGPLGPTDTAIVNYTTDGSGGNPVHTFAANTTFSGGFIVAIGYEAALNNTANNVNAIGTTAAQNNGGTSVNAIGFNAGKDNGGNELNAIGADSATGNTGNAVNALGTSAASGNTGNNVNALGEQAALSNSGNNVNVFGIVNSAPPNIYNNINLFGPDAVGDADQQTVFNNSVANLRLDYSTITVDRKQTFQDSDGIIALTSDILTLIDTTTGNDTDASLHIYNTNGSVAVSNSSSDFSAIAAIGVETNQGFLRLSSTSAGLATIKADLVGGVGQTYQIPNIPGGGSTATFALQVDDTINLNSLNLQRDNNGVINFSADDGTFSPNYTKITSDNPSGANTINFPDQSGNVILDTTSGINITQASNTLVGQTVALSSVTSITPSIDGMYIVGGGLIINSITTDVIELRVTYRDTHNNAITLKFAPIGSTTTGIGVTGTTSFPTAMISAKAGTAITLLTVLTTGIGTINYDVYGSIIKI